eukprot:7068988-Pyramimonas_sp.AAC.1
MFDKTGLPKVLNLNGHFNRSGRTVWLHLQHRVTMDLGLVQNQENKTHGNDNELANQRVVNEARQS